MIFTLQILVLCATALVLGFLGDAAFLGILSVMAHRNSSGGAGILLKPERWVLIFFIGWNIAFVAGWFIGRRLRIFPHI